MSNLCQPCVIGSLFFKNWHGFCCARIRGFRCSYTRNPPPPPPPGIADPGVVKQDKSSGGSVDTTNTRSGPQRVTMCSGERPMGAAKGKQPNTEALCHPPPPRPAPGVLRIPEVHA